MYKFMLIAALFVAGAYGECNTDVAIGCLVGKINEVATNLNRSDLCSDLASVAHCMTAAGCAGDAGFLTSMCDDTNCNVNVGTECILRLGAGLGILSSGAAAGASALGACIGGSLCMAPELVPLKTGNVCVPLDAKV
ncbi:Hypothetical predicted protein [Octopus vulgaris]|uniref:Uncharacterized protein n=1 Tax=Octopus vulgaris TaxID=6645 RepID=A0AA36FKE2_OCTVU|nr:Hypothetical predicted protein [Octopus vulgaris]